MIHMANDLGKLLMESGLIPKTTRRFVIDCESGQPIRLIVESYGEEGLVDAIISADIKIAPKNLKVCGLESCGKQFTAKRSDAEYCSDNCRQRAYQRRAVK